MRSSSSEISSVVFITTLSSSARTVSRFTGKKICRGAFASVAELITAIQAYLSAHNVNAKPFVWTKTAKVILEKDARARAKLQTLKTGHQALESEH